MKGDVAFVGFMLTADEWQELDSQSRAQLIAVATRRTDSWLEEPRPRRFPDGTGKHEVIEPLDGELEELIEPIDDEDLKLLGLECELEAAIDHAAVRECGPSAPVESAVDAGWFDDTPIEDNAIPIAAIDTPLSRALLDASAANVVAKVVTKKTVAPRRAKRTTATRKQASVIDERLLEQWLAFQPVADAHDDPDEWPVLPAPVMLTTAAPEPIEFEDFADWADL